MYRCVDSTPIADWMRVSIWEDECDWAAAADNVEPANQTLRPHQSIGTSTLEIVRP